MSVIENTTEKVCKMTEDFWDPDFFDQPDDPKKPVNIMEREDKIKLEILAPGFKKKDFGITVDNGVLNILAEHDPEEKESYLRREFSRASFSGAFSLPDNVSADSIRARYKGGVLTLNLKKTNRNNTVKKKLKVS